MATSTAYVYLDCPSCGDGIQTPFMRTGAPHIMSHQHGRTRCRIVVWPGCGGQRDYAFEVPNNMSYETACEIYQSKLDAGGWMVAPRQWATAA